MYIVNDDNLAKLPENDVPDCLWTTMEVSSNTNDAEAERSGFVSDPLAAAAEEGEPSSTDGITMNTR